MLNSEKIWKIQKKRKLNCEKIWKIQKKGKLNSEKIWVGINISSCNFFPNPINFFLFCNVYS